MIPVAGIDFGNTNCVVAVTRQNGADAVLNHSSNRLTPTMVLYTNDRRYSGELAYQNQMQYPESAITNLKRLVHLPYDSSEREEISQENPFQKLSKLEDGSVGIKIDYKGKPVILRPEQFISYLFKGLRKFEGIEKVDKLVITVNPWWRESQRRSILNACKISKIECLCLLNSPTAAAIAYVFQHRDRIPAPNAKPVNVAFVDIGGSAMTVSIASVKQQSVQMKSISYNEKVNGSLLTELFEKDLIQKVKSKYHVDPESSPRSLLRFRQAVEKAKKILSVNPAYQFEIHSFMNVDVSFIVKRDEFSSLIESVKNLIKPTVTDALNTAKVKKDEIFELQLLGGTTRVVAIKNELARIFGKEPKQSLNLDECFAIGAAYMAAYLAPKTKLPLVVRDITSHSLIARFGSEKTTVLPKFSPIPFTKIILVPVKNTQDVFLEDENGVQIGKVVITTEINQETKVSLRIKVTQSNTIEIGEGLYEKNRKTTQAKIQSSFCGDLSESEINEMMKTEDEMSRNDINESIIDDARNDLEAQIYSFNNLLEKNFYDYVDPSVVDSVRSRITEIQLWYEENEFERFNESEYSSRSAELKKLVQPVAQRMRQYEMLVGGVAALENRADELIRKYEKNPDQRIQKIMPHVSNFLQKVRNVKNTMKYKDTNFNVEKNKAALDVLSRNLESIISKK